MTEKTKRAAIKLFFSAGGGWYLPNPEDMSHDEFSAEYSRLWLAKVRLGIHWKWLDADLQVGVYSYRRTASPATIHDFLFLDISLGFAGYSLRRSRIRIRHGLHLGIWLEVYFNCREEGGPCGGEERNLEPVPLPGIHGHFIELAIRLVDGLWFEISPVTVGFPFLYQVSIALRWEGIRLR